MIGVKMGSHSGGRNRCGLHFHSECCLNEVEFPSGQCHVERAFGFKALSGKLLSLGWVAWLPWTPGWLIPHLLPPTLLSWPQTTPQSPVPFSVPTQTQLCQGQELTVGMGLSYEAPTPGNLAWCFFFFPLVLLIVLFLECSIPEPKRKFYLFNSRNIFFHLNQRSANKGPWAEASDCVFANRVYWNMATPICLYAVYSFGAVMVGQLWQRQYRCTFNHRLQLWLWKQMPPEIYCMTRLISRI